MPGNKGKFTPDWSVTCVGGWILTMFLVLLECSYIGSLCYEIPVQYQSPVGRVYNAPWMALFAMWPAMAFVIVVGTVPATICYIVLRVSNLKRRLTAPTRLWIGSVFAAVTALLFYAVVGFAPAHWQEAAPVVAGFLISSLTVMMTISVRWLGVDPHEESAG